VLRSRVVQFLTFIILAGLTVWVAALTISARGEVPDTTPIPVTLRSPTSSEITILGRDRIVAGEIDVKIRAGISQPDGSIRRIAEEHDGKIIGSSASTRIYQLSFDGLSPSELSAFSGRLAADADVERAALAVLGRILQ